MKSSSSKRKTKRHVSHDGTVREYDFESHQWILIEQSKDTESEYKKEEWLALEGRIFDITQYFPSLYRDEVVDFANIKSLDDFEGDFQINGHPLYIGTLINNGLKVRDSMDQQHGDTGNTVWDSSMALTKCIEYHSVMEMNGNHKNSEHNRISKMLNVSGRNILELGTGTGFVGLSAMLCNAQSVVLSDLEYCTENIQQNVDKNGILWDLWNDRNQSKDSNSKKKKVENPMDKVEVMELDWFQCEKSMKDHDGIIDVVIGSDVIWIKELVPALIDTLQYLYEYKMDKEHGVLIIAAQVRSKLVSDLFWNLMSSKGFSRSIVPQRLVHPDFRSNKVSINVLTKETAALGVTDTLEMM